MILTTEQIKEIIIKRPNLPLISAGIETNKKMRMHLYGTGQNTELPTVDNFESPTLRTLRVKHAKSNKDLMTRVLRPMDKVFSAKGGSVYYNLAGEKETKARSISADIRNGNSIKQWVQNFWKPHFIDDPAGIIFMEILPDPLAIKNKAEGKSVVYPTYKSTACIYDYLPSGSGLEYIVFTVDKKEKQAAGLNENETIYRVIDDSMDYYVRQEGEFISIISELSFPNYFMKVPAMLNSDIPNPNLTGAVLSPIDEIVELAKEFLLKGSIKITHDFLHGFPKYWEYADTCSKCQGTGNYETNQCPDCRGTGKNIMTKVSDAKLLSYPQNNQDPIVTPNVAGYVSPDKTYWEIATSDMSLLEDLMNYTLWGSAPMQKTNPISDDQGNTIKTATEIISEIKPQSDRLYAITEMAEKRHKFILDAAIKINIQQNYPGSMVNYGKRYMLESPDVIWEKYSKARRDGAAASVLDDLLVEYYETKYDSDPVKLAIQTKLMKVEPFVHLTTMQLKSLNPSEEDYKQKLYFTEWLSTLNEAMILSFSVDELKRQLAESVNEKQLQKEPQQAAA